MDYDFLRPCGKCIGCWTQKRTDWAIRLYHESQMHDSGSMVTMTYDQEHLPADGKLQISDPQKFIKRLRRASNEPVRYYVSGEYGERTGRAHWHLIVFGPNLMSGARPKNSQAESKNYFNPKIEELWGMGSTDVVPISPAACSYVAGYVNKKAGQEGVTTQSRKPPIAKPWVEQNLDYLIRRARVDGQIGVGNRRYPIPGIYMEWFPEELGEILDLKGEHVPPYKRGSEKINRNRELNHKARVALRMGKI